MISCKECYISIYCISKWSGFLFLSAYVKLSFIHSCEIITACVDQLNDTYDDSFMRWVIVIQILIKSEERECVLCVSTDRSTPETPTCKCYLCLQASQLSGSGT